MPFVRNNLALELHELISSPSEKKKGRGKFSSEKARLFAQIWSWSESVTWKAVQQQIAFRTNDSRILHYVRYHLMNCCDSVQCDS